MMIPSISFRPYAPHKLLILFRALPPPALPLPSSSSLSCSLSLRFPRRLFSATSLFLLPSPLLLCVNEVRLPAIAAVDFTEIDNSGGVKALDIRQGTGETPNDGDRVAVHYYGRLAAKQGWRFDSTYDHRDELGDPIPFRFTVGSANAIAGLSSAVKSMKVGGIRRVVIPPSQGYQNTMQEPTPPNYFDRQRLFTTVFNPTRLANGEGSTLGTLVFDIELLNVSHP